MPTTALVQTNQYSVDLGTAASFGLGSWDLRNETLPDPPPPSTSSLSPCMQALLASSFSDIKVGNNTYNAVRDAKFVSEVPQPYKSVVDPPAITLGLYNIHYDSNRVDINGGNNWENVRVVAEELAHTEQFLGVWQENINRRKKDAEGTQAKINVTYDDARGAWQGVYAAEVVKIAASNVAQAVVSPLGPYKSTYWNNKYELEAIQKANTIVDSLQKQGKKPCP